MRSISSTPSTTSLPTPSSSASRSSSSDLLFPWNTIRSAGNPARCATCASPPVATSRWSPSSATRRAIATQRNAFAGVRDRAVAERGAVLAAAGPQLVLVVHIERCAERLGEPGEIAARRWTRRPSPSTAAERGSRRRSIGASRRVVRHHSSSGSSASTRAISSGAWTPRIASALARPRRQASASHSRAWVSATSSLITRQSR